MEDLTLKIGDAAGATFNQLLKGDTSLTKLKNGLADLGFDANVSAMAIGWLAREDKVVIVKHGKNWNIRLSKFRHPLAPNLSMNLLFHLTR